MDMKKLRQDYRYHKHNAKVRNIKWEFTFDTWLNVWIKSGKYYERGCKKNQYCMCRYNDTGPYSPDNVRIDTNANNLRERWNKKITINGVTYESITIAALKMGINRTTLNNRINKNYYIKLSEGVFFG